MKCPFCHKELIDDVKSSDSGLVSCFSRRCPTQVEFGGIEFQNRSYPHFEILIGSTGVEEETWHLPPYRITHTEKETIVKIVDYHNMPSHGLLRPLFKTIFTTPERIHPDKPEKILARLKVLTLFS